MAIPGRIVEMHRRAAPRRRPAAWARAALPLAARADLVESLDSATVEPIELERNLADLARLARLPGGTSDSMRGIRALAPPDDVSIIDVGAGRGDMALAFAGRGWRTVALDSHPGVLRAARATLTGHPIEVVEADSRALPFPDAAFDVSHCALLLHHLDPGAVVETLREMARVARRGVVVNDLRRGMLPFGATGVAVAVLGRCRATRRDGLISVRRAYTLDELDDLLAEAGLEVRWRSAGFMPRVVTAAVRREDR